MIVLVDDFVQKPLVFAVAVGTAFSWRLQ